MLITWQAGILKLNFSLPTTVLYSTTLTTWSNLLCPFLTPWHGPHKKHSLYCYGGMFTSPLPTCYMCTLRRNVFTKLLPRSGYTCHTAPSLRLFVLNSLQAYRHFFFSEDCACNVCDWSHLPSCGSAFHGVSLQPLPLLPP
jgi:hypothetical protein